MNELAARKAIGVLGDDDIVVITFVSGKSKKVTVSHIEGGRIYYHQAEVDEEDMYMIAARLVEVKSIELLVPKP